MKYTTTVEKTEEITKETKFDVGDVVRAQLSGEVVEFEIQSIKVYDKGDGEKIYYRSAHCEVSENKLMLVREYNTFSVFNTPKFKDCECSNTYVCVRDNGYDSWRVKKYYCSKVEDGTIKHICVDITPSRNEIYPEYQEIEPFTKQRAKDLGYKYED